jgi:hypothetical protein
VAGEGAPRGEGVVFPAHGGRRSTSATGRAVVADSVRAFDPDLALHVDAAPDWRSGYLDPFRRLTTLEGSAPVEIAAAGLESAHARFVVDVAGRDMPLDVAMATGLDAERRVPSIHTAVVEGRAAGGAVPDGLSVPFGGRRLRGADLDRRLDAWLAAGTVEPSFADAVRTVAGHHEWLDARDLTVVVLGAGAEMGPVVSLLRRGAHVVAVDLPLPALWRRLVDVARSSPGRLSVPVSRWLPAGASDDDVVEAAGVDLLTQAPAVLGWLAGLQGPFTLGHYVYADGALHTRASVAVDALTATLAALRDDVSFAFLATPTDAFLVPQDAVADSRRRYAERTALRRLSRIGSMGRLFTANYDATLELPDGRTVGLNDSLVPQQGPNYALAKRIQRWRAVHERAAGRLVSLNVAPATRTRSVLRNRVLAAAYAGAHRFGVEVFDPSTSNTLMAALLVHDLRNPSAVANPAVELGHPLELLWQGANHGGLWRTPWKPRSVLGVAVVLGMVQRGA